MAHTHRPRAAYPHWQAMNASMRRAASASTARLRVKRVASNSAIWRARRSAVGMEGVPDARPVLGGVCCLDRHVADGQPWSAAAATSDLVVTPAACYPVYPLVAARGEVPAAGLLFDVAADCFRREPSRQLDRLQSFRMREFVCIGSAEQASAFRACWLARAEELAGRLGLNWRIDKASDPFFGRTGKLLAMSQVEQSLKYEEVRAARAGVFAGAPDRLHELQLPSRPLRRDQAAAHHRRRARPHRLRRLRHRPPGAGAVRHPRRRLRKLAPGRARSLAAVTDARRADGRAVRKDR